MRVHLYVPRVPWYVFCCLECKIIANMANFPCGAYLPPPRRIKDSQIWGVWGLMLPDKWYQNSNIWIFWLDLLYFDIIFCGDAFCGNDKLFTNNFQRKIWIIFGIFIGKSNFFYVLRCDNRNISWPRIVVKWELLQKIKVVMLNLLSKCYLDEFIMVHQALLLKIRVSTKNFWDRTILAGMTHKPWRLHTNF